jgi:diguanylate cyclase (GGDEF)-like protein
MDVTYTPYQNEEDQVEGVVVSARDITELKQIEESLQRRLSQFDALRETMNRITSELELDRLLRAILERAISLLNASNGQVLQYNPERNDLLVLACTNMEPDFSGSYQPLTEHGTGMVVRRRQPMLIRDYQTWENRLTDYAGFGAHAILLVPLLAGEQVLGIVSIGHTHPEKNFDESDVEMLTLFAQQATIALKNARLFAEVQRLATTDSLTGLHNRRSFFDMAQRLYDYARRYSRPLAVIMLDVDHFKQINDSFGHAIGDQVLRSMADICLSTLRTVDVVGRYGGEEFVMLLPETDLADAGMVAERLQQQVIAEPVLTDRGALAITVSLGVSHIAATCHSLEQLIDRADQALYAAKQQGRNRVIRYTENA